MHNSTDNLKSIFFSLAHQADWPQDALLVRFLNIMQLGAHRHTNIHGRTPLNERSAHRRGRYLQGKTNETNIHALSGI